MKELGHVTVITTESAVTLSSMELSFCKNAGRTTHDVYALLIQSRTYLADFGLAMLLAATCSFLDIGFKFPLSHYKSPQVGYNNALRGPHDIKIGFTGKAP